MKRLNMTAISFKGLNYPIHGNIEGLKPKLTRGTIEVLRHLATVQTRVAIRENLGDRPIFLNIVEVRLHALTEVKVRPIVDDLPHRILANIHQVKNEVQRKLHDNFRAAVLHLVDLIAQQLLNMHGPIYTILLCRFSLR